ncbi:receptor-like protein EIX2 [Phragmites australis]|uniref:receptor-like protein EIX2 n=1 Tax=Phragmites australis TaxID=29695 RepID=UPI002D7A2A86|nr:receptor-like protein EIX2 [Phragmites australis]
MVTGSRHRSSELMLTSHSKRRSHREARARLATRRFAMHAAAAILFFLALSALRGAGGCVPSELAALLDVKRGFSSDPDGVLSSWTARRPDCCRYWRGIVCDNATGRVTEIRLSNALADDGSPGLSGDISPALLRLPQLEHLDLSRNSLGGGMGTPLPRFLGSLSSLRYLNLSCTDISGEVPPQLGNLSRLVVLDLSSYLVGLYSGDLSWLTGLSSLEYLDMSLVNLNASVVWARAVNMLPSVRVLALSDCGLTTPSSSSAPERANLTRLQRLDLSSNGINTSTVHAWFWDVPTLTYLNLSGNSLSSPFPDALGNMTGLQVLNLQGNDMVGMIPATLQRLCNLQVIDVSVNQINGDMSEFMDRLPRCALRNMQGLQLSAANMSGQLPEWIGDMSELVNLDVSFNNLAGEIPQGIGRLWKLTRLFLLKNRLNGSLSEAHFANLVSLEWIDLSHNLMSMEIRPSWRPPCRLIYAYFPDVRMGPQFPAWIKHQPDIKYLDISNAGIVDTLPHWFWKSYSDAVYLNISVNQIGGKLPPSLRFMTSALAIYLGSNNLTGSVPLLPEKLLVLDLSRNSLSGPFPSEFGAPELVELDVSSNSINGTVPPSLCHFPNLLHLDLSNNNLTGHLPRCRNISSDGLGLTTLILYKNNLSGEFPIFLKHCKAMTFLDLAQNMFSGMVPEWIGRKLPSLTHLRLRSNMFSGNIPTQLAQLSDLQLLDLADNRISGSIPPSLGNMTGMTQEHTPLLLNPLTGYGASGNDRIVDSLPIVTKGQDRDYTSGVIYMVSLDLSDNVLGGEIPEELSSLTGLVNLNLSRNHLTGTIPRNIGSIQKLESLDLSMNTLSGEIPSSLSDLTSLSYLNLSYNNLSGRIPQGNQLQVLANPAYIYIGNSGLCGPPLAKNCSSGDDNKDGQAPLHGDKGLSDMVFFYLGLAVGFVVGLWLVFCSLLFVKIWRFSYFRAIDKVYDTVYVFVAVRLAKCGEKRSTNT